MQENQTIIATLRPKVCLFTLFFSSRAKIDIYQQIAEYMKRAEELQKMITARENQQQLDPLEEKDELAFPAPPKTLADKRKN